MNTYLITYNFSKPNLLLEMNLITAIKSFNFWARPLPNVWLIRTMGYRNNVMGVLQNYIGPQDKLLIMKVDNDWISLHLEKDVVSWMQSGL